MSEPDYKTSTLTKIKEKRIRENEKHDIIESFQELFSFQKEEEELEQNKKPNKYMPSRYLVTFIIDLLVLMGSYLIMVLYKPGSQNYLSPRYLTGFGILLVSWAVVSIYFKKYRFKKKYTLTKILRRIVASNLAAFSIVAICVIAFEVQGYSRLVFFGTVGIATFIELIFANLYFLLIHTTNGKTDLINPPPSSYDIKKTQQSINYRDISLSSDVITEVIVSERGENALKFISRHTNFDDHKILYTSTTTRFNVMFQPDNYFHQVVNLQRVNDIQYINKFFETVNRKLPVGGTFIGYAETKDQRKKRILRKFPPIINWILYAMDFVIKRIFPKFTFTKKIYFFLTRGQNRVLSRAEILGRLYSCGFEVVDEKDIDNYFYFVMKKIERPAYDMNPTYGPFVKLRRVGKNGKKIKVYKLRTMHPYAEYLQEYVYTQNQLAEGGKFKDDFRISGIGKFMRKLWIDELPMLFNVLKGELKIVGVRPLSEHYFSLYSDELREKRIQHKPGLIPPFYADLPKTLEEIQESEMNYLDECDKHPLRTDLKYFRKAIGNILFKRARSN